MSSPRHRATDRTPAERRASRLRRLVALATAATLAVVGVGVARGASHVDLGRDRVAAAASNLRTLDLTQQQAERRERVSRTAQRVTLRPEPVDHKFATAPLNVWQQPREGGRRFGVLKWGTRLAVTGQRVGHWAEVLLEGHARWVNATYLADKKPKPELAAGGGAATSGISTAPCPDGSATESGLVPAAVTLYRAVCAAFPQLTTYGGYDPHGEHADGHAIDFMISDSATGQAVAEWVQAHASELGIYDVIWAQHIWTPERASEGWRSMPDRGSPTANHYDHVHVSVL
jgi:hypothetical protein